MCTKDHVHFNDGNALNWDGTWHHAECPRQLTNREIAYLERIGFKIPKWCHGQK